MPAIVGTLFAIATFFQGWQVVDPTIGLLALYLIYRGSRPPRWSLVLALALVPGLFFTENPVVTSAAVIRAVTVPTVLAWAIRLPSWNRGHFALGVIASLAVQTIGLGAMIHLPRQTGFTPNASELGQVGLMVYLLTPDRPRWITWAVLATGAVTLAAAVARIPLIGVALFSVLTRRKKWLARGFVVCFVGLTLPLLKGQDLERLGIETAAAAVCPPGVCVAGEEPLPAVCETCDWPRGAFYDLLPRSIARDIAKRIQLVKGAQDGSPAAISTCQQAWSWYGEGYECRRGTFTWHGYGAGSYGASAGYPRPHIAVLVMVYELGIFAAVPAGIALWAVWTRRLPWELAAALGVLGIGIDEPLAIPFGHYTLAAVCAVWVSAQDRRRMPGAGLFRVRGCLESLRRCGGPLRKRVLPG